ncbi:MAG: hypothetical protein AAF682_19505 [Planctomycetota bacterium]
MKRALLRFLVFCALAWFAAVAVLTEASDRFYLVCDCDPWVQGPFDLDPSEAASAEVTLDVGRECVATLRLDMVVRDPGLCGPGSGTTCTEPLVNATLDGTLTYKAPIGVRLFVNDGTYGEGLVWLPLPETACVSDAQTWRFSRKCGATSFVWILAWDQATGATDLSFVTLGGEPCPKPD